jgi:short-subunit dehydrogenase
MQFTGKKVVLTGASGGIGGELARILSQNGAELILVGRNERKLRQVEETLAAGCKAQLVAADIATIEGRQRIVNACTRHGHIDALVNCAGINDFALFNDQDNTRIAQLVDTNVTAPMLLVHQLLPLLGHAREGLVANIGSTLGTIGHPGFATYCATKFALRGFSQALRRELADSTIRVKYIAPRATRTAINSADVDAMNAELGVAMDEPADVAAQIFTALARNKDGDVYLGWPEKLFARINQLLPGIVDAALRKQWPVIRRFASRGHELPASHGQTVSNRTA